MVRRAVTLSLGSAEPGWVSWLARFARPPLGGSLGIGLVAFEGRAVVHTVHADSPAGRLARALARRRRRRDQRRARRRGRRAALGGDRGVRPGRGVAAHRLVRALARVRGALVSRAPDDADASAAPRGPPPRSAAVDAAARAARATRARARLARPDRLALARPRALATGLLLWRRDDERGGALVATVLYCSPTSARSGTTSACCARARARRVRADRRGRRRAAAGRRRARGAARPRRTRTSARSTKSACGASSAALRVGRASRRGQRGFELCVAPPRRGEPPRRPRLRRRGGAAAPARRRVRRARRARRDDGRRGRSPPAASLLLRAVGGLAPSGAAPGAAARHDRAVVLGRVRGQLRPRPRPGAGRRRTRARGATPRRSSRPAGDGRGEALTRARAPPRARGARLRGRLCAVGDGEAGGGGRRRGGRRRRRRRRHRRHAQRGARRVRGGPVRARGRRRLRRGDRHVHGRVLEGSFDADTHAPRSSQPRRAFPRGTRSSARGASTASSSTRSSGGAWPLFLLLLCAAQVGCACLVRGPRGRRAARRCGPPRLMYEPVGPHRCADRRPQAWRHVGYQFVHVSWAHLAANELLELSWGLPIELVHGPARVALAHTAGVACGALACAVFDPYSRVAGASGGVYAIFGAHVADLALNFASMRRGLLVCDRSARVLALVGLHAFEIAAYGARAARVRTPRAGGWAAGLAAGALALRGVRGATARARARRGAAPRPAPRCSARRSGTRPRSRPSRSRSSTRAASRSAAWTRRRAAGPRGSARSPTTTSGRATFDSSLASCPPPSAASTSSGSTALRPSSTAAPSTAPRSAQLRARSRTRARLDKNPSGGRGTCVPRRGTRARRGCELHAPTPTAPPARPGESRLTADAEPQRRETVWGGSAPAPAPWRPPSRSAARKLAGTLPARAA